MPDVTGISIKEAEKILKDQGFEVKINNETEVLDKENVKVISQTPQSGITIYNKSCIYLDY